MAGGAFIAMLRVGAFLMLVWIASRASRLMGISSIVLEITTGLIMSPGIGGLLPKEYSMCHYAIIEDCDTVETQNHMQYSYGGCDFNAYMEKDGFTLAATKGDVHGADVYGAAPAAHRRLVDRISDRAQDMFHIGGRRLSSSTKGKTKYETYQDCLKKSCQLHLSHECMLTPDFFSFAGHIGVALMIFESGMHFDFDKAKECGPMACVIAVAGTLLPLIFGTIVIMLLCGKELFPEGISAGTALAPTSVGIALKLLNEAKQLQKPHGQIIITAAFVDDILSLVLFNCLFALGAGEVGFMTFLPAICGVLGMCGVVVFAALGYADATILRLLAYAPKKNNKLSPEDELLFFIMMIMVLVFGTAFFFSGTHLWGCFMAGMCLAKLHVAHHVWVKQTKRVTTWMIRIFFSCTVAFSIPVDKLFSIDAFWKGTIMGIGPCILTKVCCAFWMGDQKWVIGWAMVGRAEFAYLIAQLAASSDMMGPEVFSVVIWSLLYATVFAPFLFRSVLNSFVKREAMKASGGEFTAEQEAQWDKEHSNMDFRQSGHLPDLHELAAVAKKEEEREAAAEQHAQMVAHNSENSKQGASMKPVMSEHVGGDHQEMFEKAYAPAPQALGHHSDQHALKDTADTGGGQRGSGFLCCLFFRKIVIM